MENLKKIGKIKPFTIGNKIIFPLDVRWKNYFQSEPIFQAIIQNGKLVLVGPNVSTQDPTTNNNRTNQSEVDSIE